MHFSFLLYMLCSEIVFLFVLKANKCKVGEYVVFCSVIFIFVYLSRLDLHGCRTMNLSPSFGTLMYSKMRYCTTSNKEFCSLTWLNAVTIMITFNWLYSTGDSFYLVAVENSLTGGSSDNNKYWYVSAWSGVTTTLADLMLAEICPSRYLIIYWRTKETIHG